MIVALSVFTTDGSDFTEKSRNTYRESVYSAQSVVIKK